MIPVLRAMLTFKTVLVALRPEHLHAESFTLAIPADSPELVALHALLRAKHPLHLVPRLPACDLIEILAGQSDRLGIILVGLEPRNTVLFLQVKDLIAHARDPHCLRKLFYVAICAD